MLSAYLLHVHESGFMAMVFFCWGVAYAVFPSLSLSDFCQKLDGSVVLVPCYGVTAKEKQQSA